MDDDSSKRRCMYDQPAVASLGDKTVWKVSFACSIYNIHVYVGHKVWICAIPKLRCANHGSVLCAGNQWIACTRTSQFF